MQQRGASVDRATQAWVRGTGRRVVVAEHPWLLGPVGATSVIGEEWLAAEALRTGGELREGGGLLSDVNGLASDEFDPAQIAPEIVDFYQSTSEWRLDLWSQWSVWAWPFGWILSAVFARRLRQLSLPLRPLDVARGMDSRVVSVVDAKGRRLGAAWLRTLRATGQTVYSGWYGIVALPSTRSPSIRVVFPLPIGSLTVFLRPANAGGGRLRLTSPLGRFGEEGAYLLVSAPDRTHAWVRRVPLVESFDVYVDEEGVLRTDHHGPWGNFGAPISLQTRAVDPVRGRTKWC
ncbi:MAG TPA: hypothetical protein VM121_05765 [Acidimicrobiales bacterium]|nr:hypothetical protein [Acidimicrobiales bacterium]